MPTSPNAMRDQILATPPALVAAFDQLERNARLAVPTPEIYRTRRIVLTGSGDSFFAAKAAEAAFWQYARVPTEARVPMEAGRFQSQLMPAAELENTLLVSLSNSGGASRVIEATQLMAAKGANVLAVTRNADGRLVQAAARKLILPIPELPSAPGFGPYLFATLGLILFAIRFGEVRMTMTMDEAQAIRGQLKRLVGSLAQTIEALDAPAKVVAEAIAPKKLAEFVGAGPSWATAEYGAAKLLEASGRHALARDLEEWTHLNYFDAAPEEVATVAIVPPGSVSQGRATELLAYWTKLGRTVVAIGDDAFGATARAAGHLALPLPPVDEAWSALTASAAVALIAAHLAEIDGAEYGRGSAGRWSDSQGGATVQNSAVWSAKP